METLERTFIIQNKHGVHTRVAYSLAEAAGKYTSTIFLQCGGRQADCSSILDILSLAVCCGKRISIVITGDDADEAMSSLTSLLDCRESVK